MYILGVKSRYYENDQSWVLPIFHSQSIIAYDLVKYRVLETKLHYFIFKLQNEVNDHNLLAAGYIAIVCIIVLRGFISH